MILIFNRRFMESRVSYCISVYGLLDPKTLQTIQVAQNTVLRIICSFRRSESISIPYPLLNILPLNQSILSSSAILTCKFLRNNIRSLSVQFHQHVTHYTTRSSLLTLSTISRARTNYRAFSFINTAATLWNTLLTETTFSYIQHFSTHCVFTSSAFSKKNTTLFSFKFCVPFSRLLRSQFNIFIYVVNSFFLLTV